MELYIISGLSILVIIYFANKPQKCINCGEVLVLSRDFDPDIPATIIKCSNCGHEVGAI